MLLATFGAFLLLQQPFKDSKFWKLPICAAVVFCTLLKELLDLATALMLQDETWLNVKFARVMVWLFTVTVLSLPVIMLVSFFYYNYMRSVTSDVDGKRTAQYRGLGMTKRSTLIGAIWSACAVGTAAQKNEKDAPSFPRSSSILPDLERSRRHGRDHEMLTIVPPERLAKKINDGGAGANNDSNDDAREEEGRLDSNGEEGYSLDGEAHEAGGMS